MFKQKYLLLLVSAFAVFRFGTVGNINVQGEDVKKLDVLSNELFINMLTSSYTTALMVSEENTSVIEVTNG